MILIRDDRNGKCYVFDGQIATYISGQDGWGQFKTVLKQDNKNGNPGYINLKGKEAADFFGRIIVK